MSTSSRMAVSAMALSVFGFKRESLWGAVDQKRAGRTTLTAVRNALVLALAAFALVLVTPSSVTAQSWLHKPHSTSKPGPLKIKSNRGARTASATPKRFKRPVGSTSSRPRNVVWASGAQRTGFGGIASGAKTTPFGVAKGQKTNFGYIAPGARTTPFGVTSGQKTNFGVMGSGAQRTSYGVSGGQRTSTGVIARGGQKTSFGAVGAGCRKTPFGFVCSDVRLKRDVVEVARLDNGLGLYRYRYLWSDRVYVGVMAQEVAKLVPHAVMRGADGYLRVNYAELGLRLRTWDDWVAAH